MKYHRYIRRKDKESVRLESWKRRRQVRWTFREEGTVGISHPRRIRSLKFNYSEGISPERTGVVGFTGEWWGWMSIREVGVQRKSRE